MRFITELSAPTVLISPNMTSSKGQNVEVSCNVTGNPSPEVAWFRNGEKINISGTVKDCKQLKSGFYKIQRDEEAKDEVGRSRLLVCSVNHLEHTGSYTCQATNNQGNDTAATYLNILGMYRRKIIYWDRYVMK